jgi:hypothetical protein
LPLCLSRCHIPLNLALFLIFLFFFCLAKPVIKQRANAAHPPSASSPFHFQWSQTHVHASSSSSQKAHYSNGSGVCWRYQRKGKSSRIWGRRDLSNKIIIKIMKRIRSGTEMKDKTRKRRPYYPILLSTSQQIFGYCSYRDVRSRRHRCRHQHRF